MFETKPTVSVIIPTYNREKLVHKAIDSVLRQTFSDFELIVIDDASIDQTKAVVNQFEDVRIRYLCHKKNEGVCAARNTGIAAAQGRYIAFLDSDDEWLPDKLEKQVVRFKDVPERVGAIYTWLQIIDEHEILEKVRQPSIRGRIEQDLLYSNFIGTPSTLLIKSEFLKKTERFDTRLRCCEDWDMWLQLAQYCEFDLIAEPLVRYRNHSEENRGSTNSSVIVEGYLIFRKKHHTDLLTKYRQIGSFSLSQKAGYLFNFGRRLLCHGNKIQRHEAIALGQKYLWIALQANPLSLQTAFHYCSSYLGSQVYLEAVQLENKSKQALASILK
jgi:glycosyltransferase involved in cell wall biosynthesis